METTIKIPKPYLFVLNQLFELEQKAGKLKEDNSIFRNIDKMRNYFAIEALPNNQGLIYHSPVGERYDETRTDCEATITGANHTNLVIIEVLRPIIYIKFGSTQLVTQKAIVIVQSK